MDSRAKTGVKNQWRIQTFRQRGREGGDLWIQGRERLRVRDLTQSFLAYSQNIDSPESVILPFFTRKVSTVTFSEGGYVLSRSQKWSNFQHLITRFRHFDILAKIPFLSQWSDDGYHVFPPKWRWFTRQPYLVLRKSRTRSRTRLRI